MKMMTEGQKVGEWTGDGRLVGGEEEEVSKVYVGYWTGKVRWVSTQSKHLQAIYIGHTVHQRHIWTAKWS